VAVSGYFKSIRNQISTSLSVTIKGKLLVLRIATIRQAPESTPVDGIDGQLGLGTLFACKTLALLCLFLGILIAAVVPASLEQRIGSVFFFGLIPAAGFYAWGHLFRQALVRGSALCDVIASYGLGWWGGNSIWSLDLDGGNFPQESPVDTVVERIIRAD
jgi:hypothetical protein